MARARAGGPGLASGPGLRIRCTLSGSASVSVGAETHGGMMMHVTGSGPGGELVSSAYHCAVSMRAPGQYQKCLQEAMFLRK